MLLAVEIGGTFTDLIALDFRGRITTAKVPSTPGAPEVGALRAMEQASVRKEGLTTVVHGSTIATNGVLERKGARVGLLVTRGFGDLLELQRQDRSEPYSLKYSKPVSLVPRKLVAEIDERILADGKVLAEPSAEQVKQAIDALLERGATSVAVCLLHSYAFPEHESLIGDLLAAEYPETAVTLSHHIVPEHREYERASTTVLSGYVKPLMDEYLDKLEKRLREEGFRGDLHIMQSNGGSLPAALIRRQAVRTLLSGPAGGVTAARTVAGRLGRKNVITFDMGGTSTDVCLVQDGEATLTQESHIDGLPVGVPMLDIVTVGSGGGSFADVDAGGLLQVGPESAGAEPGPACYGRGGTKATVTDANVVLGLIRPEGFLGGHMELDSKAAFEACAVVGKRLGMGAVEAAGAIVRVANAQMYGALRLVSVERGVDTRDFWLMCYGGAGGLHAAALADELGARGAIVPRHPGLFSAYGLLISDLQCDWSAPFLRSASEFAPGDLSAVVKGLREAAIEEWISVGKRPEEIRYRLSLDMRYPGQGFEVEVGVSERDLLSPEALAGAFHAAHRKRYGHAAEHEDPEVVTVRLSAVIPREVGEPPWVPDRVEEPEEYEIYVHGKPDKVAFFAWNGLAANEPIVGPAVIREATSTVWVPAGWKGHLDSQGHLHVEREGQ